MERLNQEEWKQLIADYRSSGLSAPAWCQQKQISIHKLRYWINKINRALPVEKTEQQWVSVLQSGPNASSSDITVKIANAEISISEGFNKQLFLEVVQVLPSLC